MASAPNETKSPRKSKSPHRTSRTSAKHGRGSFSVWIMRCAGPGGSAVGELWIGGKRTWPLNARSQSEPQIPNSEFQFASCWVSRFLRARIKSEPCNHSLPQPPRRLPHICLPATNCSVGNCEDISELRLFQAEFLALRMNVLAGGAWGRGQRRPNMPRMLARIRSFHPNSGGTNSQQCSRTR